MLNTNSIAISVMITNGPSPLKACKHLQIDNRMACNQLTDIEYKDLIAFNVVENGFSGIDNGLARVCHLNGRVNMANASPLYWEILHCQCRALWV